MPRLLWLAKVTPGSRLLALYAVAWCALPLLQPYTQKTIALVVLVWPALVAAASLGLAGLSWQRTAIFAAAAIGVGQLLAPSPYSHRLMQVLGFDVLLCVLLLAGLTGVVLREPKASEEDASAGGEVAEAG